MDNKFTVRQLKIIATLYKATSPINSTVLSKELECSTKTVQSEIKNINSTLENGCINSIKGSGYELIGKEEYLRELVEDIKEENRYKEDRVFNIIEMLLILYLYKRESIKLEDLASNLYISLSTLKNDLKEVKSLLEKYKIDIVSKHKKGISIQGDIEDIKRYILSLIQNNKIEKPALISETVLENEEDIKHIILNKLDKESIVLTDLEYKSIFNYLVLSISINNERDYKSYIEEYIESYKKEINQGVVTDLTVKEDILNVIDKFTQNLKVVASIDITKDTDFKEYLARHIQSVLVKQRLGIKEMNTMVDNIKVSYPFAFELAKIAKKVIEDNLEITIDESELGNIAIHVGGALQRISYKESKRVLRAIIVCTSGVGTSMLIKAKLEARFDKKIEIVKVIPSYLLDYVSILDIDFIISTVPIDIDTIPAIQISPLLTDTEIRIIEKYLETGDVYYEVNLDELFERKLFFTDIDSANRYEIIDYMASKLYENGYIDEEMRDSYKERENIATTEIGNLVAIPHGMKGKVNKNTVAIGILKKDITWEVSKVRLIVMLCLDKEKIIDYEDLFSKIYKRVDSIAKVISICESKNFDKFIAMFK